jgi:class 3 adenylate cyclase
VLDVAETRKLAAILAADVAGYSKLASSDEERTLARLRGLRSDLIDPAISVHHGRVVKRTGDGSIIEFCSVAHWSARLRFPMSPAAMLAPVNGLTRSGFLAKAQTGVPAHGT